MLWKKPHQCCVCGFRSRKGEKIHGQFMCQSCENEMVRDMEREYNEHEWAEINRITNQRGNDGHGNYRVG